MILQALVSYYEALAARGEISRPGYSLAKVSYALRIGWDGTLLGIVPMKVTETRGKKEVQVPRVMEVPEQALRGNPILSNFLCDHGGYFLGVDDKGKPERSLQCYAAARELHQTILSGISTPVAKAVLGFFEKWQPEGASNHPLLQPYMEDILAGTNMVFSLPNASFVHNDPAIKGAWERYKNSQEAGARKQCLVTGKQDQPIAILHGKIKGVKDAQPAGASLVSFNARAYESYGRDEEQGLNAPVSEYAAFAYVTVLNHLLADTNYRQYMGDSTVVYWADDGDPIYQETAKQTVFSAVGDQALLHDIMDRAVKGKAIDIDLKGIRWDMPFYVLALSPNAARVSVRFFWRQTFGAMMDHIADHYEDLKIDKAPYEKEFLLIEDLLAETVSPKAQNEKDLSLLMGALLRSILTGTPYPESLAQTVLLRVRVDQTVNRGKAAILKAWLLRNSKPEELKEYREVLIMSRNESSRVKAYVLGRLFAVLEEAQEKTSETDIKATIRSRFFASACASPGTVFPTMLRLNNFHLIKIARFRGENVAIAYSRRIRDLMDKLEVEDDPYPNHLDLKQQGLFALGYHQEMQARYQKKAPAAGADGNAVTDAEEITDTKEEA